MTDFSHFIPLFQKIISSLRDGLFVAILFGDISKAYDCLNRAIVTYLLHHNFGIRGRILWKQANALINMAIKSLVDGVSTEEFTTKFGGPQGITQLIEFWRIICNSMYVQLKKELPTALFALWGDDTTGVIAAKTPQELQARMELFYTRIMDWCRQTRCHMHETKSQYMVFGHNKQRQTQGINMQISVARG